ncbi:hypothetical protein EXN66_Car007146 [Channa argus]|uniref:Uncharacterized protein n=1 Tax=Channa argus TaxID=215402 RepID=A0A6G1PMB3_CHAAH|nr:hypothetical protein EXN66_Car007146 [Channa argus]
MPCWLSEHWYFARFLLYFSPWVFSRPSLVVPHRLGSTSPPPLCTLAKSLYRILAISFTHSSPESPPQLPHPLFHFLNKLTLSPTPLCSAPFGSH